MNMCPLSIYRSATGSRDIRKMFPDYTVEYIALGKELFLRTKKILKPPITVAFYYSLLLAVENNA